MQREIAIMKKISHPNVVNLHQVINDTDKIHLVLEYVDGGPVVPEALTCTPIPEAKAQSYFRQIISGLDYLHLQNVVHCDIKPSNILLTSDETIKLVDFGIARIVKDNDDKVHATSGTPAFMSPQASLGRGTFAGRALDLWAAGVTLFFMVTGTLPFWDTNAVELSRKICEEPLIIPPNPPLSSQLCDLLTHLLQKNEKKRMNMYQVQQHTWVTDSGAFTISTPRFKKVQVTDEEVEHALTPVNVNQAIMLAKLKLRVRSWRAASQKRFQPKLEPTPASPVDELTHQFEKSFIPTMEPPPAVPRRPPFIARWSKAIEMGTIAIASYLAYEAMDDDDYYAWYF